jgi:AcrR family transcriptional regulator
MRRGEDTRNRILDAAQHSVLSKGFGATSIEEIIAETGITKSGFFYHFRDKNELAKALISRYVEADERIYDDVFGRARDLVDDPLHAFLLGLKLLAGLMADMPNGHPGCLVAVACYNERQFDRDVRALNAEAVLLWRRRFRAMFEAIVERYPPREAVDLDEMADMMSAMIEGAIVLSKALGDPKVLERQILAYRAHVKAMFLPDAPVAR